ncbi:unnamed protein product [Leptosia nina]|uniref:Uncharacterized protein n=1 Tax=Leptosia nina TaxID=320188 RepID=A0AAV1K340_9NEOP
MHGTVERNGCAPQHGNISNIFNLAIDQFHEPLPPRLLPSRVAGCRNSLAGHRGRLKNADAADALIA